MPNRMAIWYMAHPVGGDVLANLSRAKRWLAWLQAQMPIDVVVIAPWITAIEVGADDGDPAQRERGLRGDCALVRRCDGVFLVGGRISEGMAREAKYARATHDLTFLGDEPPLEDHADA